jgi:DNA invertase Pin-like site-specific DNA recombinase
VGVARARAEGKYRGRAPTARRQIKRVAALRAEGLGASAIAAQVGISRASVYRLLAEARAA